MSRSAELAELVSQFAAEYNWRLAPGPVGPQAISAATPRAHLWVDSATQSLMTLVIERRSPFRFVVGSDYIARPSRADYRVVLDHTGERTLASVDEVTAEVSDWMNSHRTELREGVRLIDDEELYVSGETLALSFQAATTGDVVQRLGELQRVAGLLPTKRVHRLPADLLKLRGLIRQWAIPDDRKRSTTISSAKHGDLRELAAGWRSHVDRINATIDADPTSPLSSRLIAFSQAGMEAELALQPGDGGRHS